MKKLPFLVVVLAAIAAASWLALSIVSKIQRTDEAHKFGYDHMYSSDAKGIDRHIYNVKVYWNDLKSIPGSNRILVRISNSRDEFHDQAFSTDRVWLTDVWIQKHKDSDDLIFRINNLTGKPNDYLNKVSKSGLIGYPQQMQTKQDAVAKILLGAQPKNEPSSEFAEYYADWHNECEAIKESSNTYDYIRLPSYRKIVAIGKPALPYLEQKMKDDIGLDFMLAFAVVEICGWNKKEFQGGGEQKFRDRVLSKLQQK